MNENKTANMSTASLFRKTAQKAVNGSPIMLDDNGGKRKKYQGRDIAAAYPDGIFITDFDIINVNDRANPGNKKPIGIYAFAETGNGPAIGYTNGSANITHMILEWVSVIGEGNVTATRDAYKASGERVRVKLSYEVDPNTGNNIQKVEVM